MVSAQPFEWQVDIRGCALSSDRKQVVRGGGPLRTYRPHRREPAAHYVFATLYRRVGQPPTRLGSFWKWAFPDRETALAAFVGDYGFVSAAERESESVEYLMHEQERLARFYSQQDPARASLRDRSTARTTAALSTEKKGNAAGGGYGLCGYSAMGLSNKQNGSFVPARLWMLMCEFSYSKRDAILSFDCARRGTAPSNSKRALSLFLSRGTKCVFS